MSEWTEKAQKEAEAQVLRRAANDPEFRKLALSDGRKAIEQATGKSLPAGFNVRFVDPAGAHLTVVLPRAASGEQELSEAELSAVAGGKGHHHQGGAGTHGGSGDGGDETGDSTTPSDVDNPRI